MLSRFVVGLGNSPSPTGLVDPASTTAMTAEAVAVPKARIRVLSPLAAAVSEDGTACMIRVGMAAYPMPMPMPISSLIARMCQACNVERAAMRYPAAMMLEPVMSNDLGPHRCWRRPAIGDIASIANPEGIRMKLACNRVKPIPPARAGISNN